MNTAWISLILFLFLLASYHKRMLSASGFVGALALALCFVFFKEWLFLSMMIFFFLSSSLLTQWEKTKKRAITEGQTEKGGRRDLFQVAANGGVPWVIGCVSFFHPSSYGLFAFLGSLATVMADTWGTELGLLSGGPVRVFWTGKIVKAGTSGGVTAAGYGGGFLGSALLGVFAWVMLQVFQPPVLAGLTFSRIFLVSVSSGVLGMSFDSLLGATCQTVLRCDTCAEETEMRIHVCGRTTRRLKGLAVLSNDGVNALSSLVGSLMGLGFGVLFR